MRLSVIAAMLASFTAIAPAHAADAAHPVVVELFQSQGCSSCPPANANINALIASRPDILALSFAVTYWDQLGWKDGFAKASYTQRQWDYAAGLGNAQVWTPQVLVNGRTDVAGNNRAAIEAAIARAAPPAGAPSVDLAAASVAIGAGVAPPRGADVWLVRYDPRTVAVAVKAGENGGRTLPHRNIVRELVKLGQWTGKPAQFAVPAASDGLATAVLVQSAHGGPILAATRG